MLIKSMVFSGVLRGQPLIDKYYHRLIGLIGFEPYRGTMDVKLERKIDIRLYATKAVEHVLMDGTKHTDVYLAPVVLIVKGQRYNCWAMQEAHGVYAEDIVELLAKDKLKDKLGIEDRNIVELEFSEAKKKKKSVLSKFRPKREVTLTKR